MSSARRAIPFLAIFAGSVAYSGCSDDAPAPVESPAPDTAQEELDTAVVIEDTDTADDTAEIDVLDSELDTGSADLDSSRDSELDTEVGPADAADAEVADAAGDSADAEEVEAGPPVVCTGVTVNDLLYGTSRELRQGASAIQLDITGTDLDSITTASLGSGPCTVVTRAATSAQVQCNVAHGAPLGAITLTIGNGTSTSACTDTLTITKITTNAASSAASDTTGVGTTAKPFRSIGKSLSVADTGDTVLVLANGTGSYGTGTSDGFVAIGTSTNPYGTPTANVKAGVTIEGDTRTGMTTRIVGTRNAGVLVFRLAGDATIKNLVIDGFRYGVSANAGAVALDNVSFKNAGGDALIAFGTAKVTIAGACDYDAIDGSGVNTSGTASLTMPACTLHNHGGAALSVNGMSSVTGVGLKIYANGRDSSSAPNGFPGVVVRDSATLSLTTSDVNGNFQGGVFGEGAATIELTASRVFNNGKRVGATTNAPTLGGTRMDGVRITDGKALTIVSGEVYDNGASGVGAYESSNYTGLMVSITGTKVQGNHYDGVRFDCDGKLVMRNATLEDNSGNALQVENAPTLIDLGTALVPGNNTLRRMTASSATGSGGAALLGDFRPARISADGAIITVAGTTLQSTTPTAGVKVGPTTSIVSGQLLYEIANSNNRIQFF